MAPDYIKKILYVKQENVTCINCQCNYPAPHDPASQKFGKWCQVHSFPVDPGMIGTNEDCAAKCKQWIPRELHRSYCNGEEENPECWYEKDSIA
jgi:hypothetical protein